MPVNPAQNVGDILKTSMSSTVNDIFHSLEPQINQFANQAAHVAVDRTRDIAIMALSQVRRQPWYLIGAAAALLVGAALVIGFNEVEEVPKQRPLTH